MTIAERKGEGLNLGLAHSQVLNQCSINAVVPGDNATRASSRGVCGRAHRQRTQRTSRGRHRTLNVSVRQINIRKGYRAAVGQVACRTHQFSDRSSHIAGRHHRRVVRPGDLHHKGLAVCATIVVIHRHRVGQGHNFSGSQVVERGIGRRKGHRHAAGGGTRCLGYRADADQRLERCFIQRQSGGHAASDRPCDRSRVTHIGQVYIAKAGRNALAQRGSRRLFIQVRLGDRSNNRRIIRTRDGDAHRARSASSAIVDRHIELLNLGLVQRQVFNICRRNRVAPGQLSAAAGAAGSVAVLDCRQRAQWRANIGNRHRVCVAQVNVGKGDDAAVGQAACGRLQFSHRSGHIGV